jgi:hypothetical protein
MPSKNLFTFSLPADLKAGLRAVKVRTGATEAEQIRRGIRLWLEANGATVPAPEMAPRTTPRTAPKAEPEKPRLTLRRDGIDDGYNDLRLSNLKRKWPTLPETEQQRFRDLAKNRARRIRLPKPGDPLHNALMLWDDMGRDRRQAFLVWLRSSEAVHPRGRLIKRGAQ